MKDGYDNFDDQTLEYLKLHHVQICEFDEQTGDFVCLGDLEDFQEIDHGPDADEAEDPLEV